MLLPVPVNGTRSASSITSQSVTKSGDKMATSCDVSDFTISYVSINDTSKAEKIAEILLERRLAACIQIIPKVTSLYRWKGKVEKDEELLMLIKSRQGKLAEMTRVVTENHPYEVCEVVTVPITHGNPAYLKWLAVETSDDDPAN